MYQQKGLLSLYDLFLAQKSSIQPHLCWQKALDIPSYSEDFVKDVVRMISVCHEMPCVRNSRNPGILSILLLIKHYFFSFMNVAQALCLI